MPIAISRKKTKTITIGEGEESFTVEIAAGLRVSQRQRLLAVIAGNEAIGEMIAGGDDRSARDMSPEETRALMESWPKALDAFLAAAALVVRSVDGLIVDGEAVKVPVSENERLDWLDENFEPDWLAQVAMEGLAANVVTDKDRGNS